MKLLSNQKKTISTGAVREIGDEICISKSQRNVHVTFEAMAVFAAAPFLIYMGSKKNLYPWERYALYTMAGVTLVVDGGLLLSYMRKK